MLESVAKSFAYQNRLGRWPAGEWKIGREGGRGRQRCHLQRTIYRKLVTRWKFIEKLKQREDVD